MNEPVSTIQSYDVLRDSAGYHYDAELAERAVEFFRRHLRHTKGDKAGQAFELESWQESVVRTIYGWVDDSGNRRYREVFIFVPRKNGKSTLCAGFGLKSLAADHEQGNEVYVGAGKREQAGIIFKQAAEMVQTDEALDSACIVKQHEIEYPKTFGRFKCLASEGGTSLGLNPHCLLIDELVAHKNREFVDSLTTAVGARRQPLTIYITTAGLVGTEHILVEKYKYACSVRDGKISDPQFLPVIYELPDTLDWKDERNWHIANPNLGVSVSLDYLRRECKKAIATPSYEPTFRTLHLNQFVQASNSWLVISHWDACDDPPDHANGTTIMGLDLSSTTDLTAISAVTLNPDGKYSISAYHFVPENRILERDRKDKAPFIQWKNEGWVESCPGDVIDYEYIFSRIIQLAAEYETNRIACDPYHATQIIQKLEDEGLTPISVRQGFISLSPPAKELERACIAGLLRHGGNPVLRWQAGHVAIDIDPAGNIKPAKNKSTERIDGIAATLNALSRLLVEKPENPNKTSIEFW